MKQLYIEQKVFSLRDKFTVKDQQEKDVYYVEGSFIQFRQNTSTSRNVKGIAQ